MNKNIFKHLSKIGAVTVAFSVLSTATVFAANGDIWNTTTKQDKGSVGKLLLNTDKTDLFGLINNMGSYGYEFNGNIYSAGDVNTAFNSNPSETAAQAVAGASIVSPVPVATGLAVSSVSAINGKQIAVTFSQAVDKDSVIEPTGSSNPGTLVDGVFSILALKQADGTTASVNPGIVDNLNASLSADGKTLTINAGTYLKGNYTVAVNKGVTALGVAVPAYSTIINVADTTGPTLVSSTASAKTTTKTINLNFSEPVDSTGAVAYINGAPAVLSAGSSSDELVLTSSTDITAGSTVAVSLLNIKDAAGNVLATNPTKTNVTVTADTSAPVVSSVNVTGEKTFNVTFSKPVSETASNFLNNVGVVTSGLGATTTPFTVVPSSLSTDGKTVSFTTSTAIFGTSNTFAGTLVISKAVTDATGNALGTDFTQAISFTEDMTAPTITSVATNSTNNKILVTYSKNVTLVGSPSATISGITLIDGNGSVVALAPGATASVVNSNQLQIDNNGVALAAGNYTVRVAANLLTDGLTNSNKNSATTQALTVASTTAASDTVAPTVAIATGNPTGYAAVGTAPAAEQTLSYTVQDTGAGIDIASVLNVANYTIDGAVLPTGTYFTTSGYSASAPTGVVTVTIHIPSSSISKSTTASQLVISNLKDLAGNVITPAVSGTFALTDGVAPTLSSVAIASGDNTTLAASFSEAVTGVAKSKITVTLNGVDVTSAATLTPVLAGPDKGKYYVQVAESFDSTTGTAYIDANNSASLNTGDVTLATGVTSAPADVDFTSTAVTGLKLGLTTATGVTDAQGNLVTVGTITVK